MLLKELKQFVEMLLRIIIISLLCFYTSLAESLDFDFDFNLEDSDFSDEDTKDDCLSDSDCISELTYRCNREKFKCEMLGKTISQKTHILIAYFISATG